MPEQISKEMVDAIREVETAIVRGQYREIGSESRVSRLSASEIAAALEEYGGKVTPTPEHVLQQMEALRIQGSDPPQWAVDFDLWIDGKPSDLTLSLTIGATDEGKLLALVDDLHVL